MSTVGISLQWLGEPVSHAELYKMVCSDNESFTDITIPSLMLPKSAGTSLEESLTRGEEGMYSDMSGISCWRQYLKYRWGNIESSADYLDGNVPSSERSGCCLIHQWRNLMPFHIGYCWFYECPLSYMLTEVLLSAVRVSLYSPRRPLVDIAEVFLWLMAVGSILGASFWSAWTAKEAAQEHYRRFKVW